ncbi:Domain found in IF2B/IF5 family protein [Tritrichomonas foetus]|uniref:Domain found in IF2B/IF5 family protein n=1 Tax=Tritrichomonas foetus TaxID=1144522 RepID=A0A1J4KVP4_9EUKA|nr:Domain found in IF2B/IF5 family protein [Tritrichomonas foetus]|eukprot:OHT14960.1 Domain found in IF2B/IF5 family protein [Tritrichomonas foetus]
MPAKAPIPIKKDADDHYRYKMPALASRQISSGNGIKTAILNAKPIAKAIGRTPASLTQWYSYSQAIQAKQAQNQGQIVLNGDHDNKKLLASLYEFIDTFVLCPVCQNPETTMDRRGQGLILHCNSCGNTSQVNATKTAYMIKMNDWILSHLTTESRSGTATTNDRAGKIDLIDAQHEAESKNEGTGQGVFIDVEELEKIRKSLEGEVNQEKPQPVSAEEENAFFEKLTSLCRSADSSDTEIYRELRNYQNRAGMKDSSMILMLFEALFADEPLKILDVIVKHRSLLLLMTMNETNQRDFLSFLCQFICKTHPELMSSAPVIFYTLYDNEIIEDAGVSLWLKKASARFEKDKQKASDLRNVILKDFLKWINEAAYEETEEPENPPEQSHNDENDEKEEDLDIDSI